MSDCSLTKPRCCLVRGQFEVDDQGFKRHAGCARKFERLRGMHPVESAVPDPVADALLGYSRLVGGRGGAAQFLTASSSARRT